MGKFGPGFQRMGFEIGARFGRQVASEEAVDKAPGFEPFVTAQATVKLASSAIKMTKAEVLRALAEWCSFLGISARW